MVTISTSSHRSRRSRAVVLNLKSKTGITPTPAATIPSCDNHSVHATIRHRVDDGNDGNNDDDFGTKAKPRPAMVTPTNEAQVGSNVQFSGFNDTDEEEDTDNYEEEDHNDYGHDNDDTEDTISVDDAKKTKKRLEREIGNTAEDERQTAAALHNLWDGVRTLQLFLQTATTSSPTPSSLQQVHQSHQMLLDKITDLSNKLPGLLGDDMLGLTHAVCTQHVHMQLHTTEACELTDDLDTARRAAIHAHARADYAEDTCRRLFDEKQHLIGIVRRLKAERRILKEEVLTLRQQIESTRLVDAVAVHEQFLRATTSTPKATRESEFTTSPTGDTTESQITGGKPPASGEVNVTSDDHQDESSPLSYHVNATYDAATAGDPQAIRFQEKYCKALDTSSNVDKAKMAKNKKQQCGFGLGLTVRRRFQKVLTEQVVDESWSKSDEERGS